MAGVKKRECPPPSVAARATPGTSPASAGEVPAERAEGGIPIHHSAARLPNNSARSNSTNSAVPGHTQSNTPSSHDIIGGCQLA